MRGLRRSADAAPEAPARPAAPGLRSGPLTAEDVYPADPTVLVPAPAVPADLSVNQAGRRLGELLVAEGLLRPDQVVEALRLVSPSRRLGQVLVEGGSLDERDLARVLAAQAGLGFVDLSQVTPSSEATRLLPEALARSLVAVPVSVEDGAVSVAVADPYGNTSARLAEELGSDVTLLVAAPSDIARAVGTAYRALSGVDAHVQAFSVRDAARRGPAVAETPALSDNAPAVQVVQMIVTQGLRDRASDIHIEPQGESVRVRFRIDGALHDVLSLPGAMGPVVVSRIKVMGGMNIVERRRPQDGQIALSLEGRELDVRVSTTATIWGEKVVLRLLDKSRPLYRLAELGMPDAVAARFSRHLESPFGMVVCAGPTGSGKTTTLYGSIGKINRPDRNIMTIEDPVEYTFPSINQIQINEQAGITFAGGLRSILRQDPDVILVGEVRDVETARVAVQAALTGHLVLSSLHATDAVSALHRLLDMGIEPFLVASSVTALVSQRLVRRVCSYCAAPHEPSGEDLELLESLGGSVEDGTFKMGAGCNFCAHTGYLERIGVYELLTVTEPIRRLVLRNASHSEIRAAARAEGMRTLQEEAVALVQAGVTTVPEVLRSIYVVEA